MRFTRLLVLTTLQLALLASAFPAQTKGFTQADLKKIVAELDGIIPHNPGYKYPIKVSLVDGPDVNAHAGYEMAGNDKQAIMVVYTGFVKATGGQTRLVRACVAHELTHLAKGHSLEGSFKAQDFDNLWTRQQEFEADKGGAEALLKLGYPKKDMIDLMMILDSQMGRRSNWLYRLTADHADPKARAAELSDNPKAFQALITFDTALAYEDAREHSYARALFEKSVADWPELTDAYTNAAKCALLFYYDNLPTGIREGWWRPDFGPLITNPHAAAPQPPDISDQDRAAWKRAFDLAQVAVAKNPQSDEASAMLALAQVLEPDAKKEIVAVGVAWFKAHAASATDKHIQLRYANNAGVGLQRTSDVDAAYATIMDAQRGSTAFNAALGENLGLAGAKGRSKDDSVLAANVLFTWLENTPDSSPNWKLVKSTLDGICATAHLTTPAISEKPAFLAEVTTLRTSGKQLGLLLPVSGLIGVMGQPDQAGKFDDRFPDLLQLKWKSGLTILTERGKVMRLTTTETGAYLVLKPKDPTSQDKFRVAVGMTKRELFALLNEKASVEKPLADGGSIKTWNYFPMVGMGVLIENDKVAAITVTPVVYIPSEHGQA